MPDRPVLAEEVRTAAEFTAAATRLVAKIKQPLWWRGHSKACWELVPGVFRAEPPKTEEKNLGLRFMAKAPSRYSGCPRFDDNPAWLFLMQHYGLPTRLLDWSESPLVAAYFATNGHREEPGTVWSLLPFKLNERSLSALHVPMPRHPSVIGLFDAALGGAPIGGDTVAAVQPLETDPRMLAQHTVFTIHASARSISALPDPGGILYRIDIPADAKAGFNREMRALGIRRSNLFPDLTSLALDIAEFGPQDIA